MAFSIRASLGRILQPQLELVKPGAAYWSTFVEDSFSPPENLPEKDIEKVKANHESELTARVDQSAFFIFRNDCNVLGLAEGMRESPSLRLTKMEIKPRFSHLGYETSLYAALQEWSKNQGFKELHSAQQVNGKIIYRKEIL